MNTTLTGRIGAIFFVASLLTACGGGSDNAPPKTGPTGANGKNALVAVSAEAVGANCSVAGSRIDAGSDTNANGVLDAAEISSTQYVCGGATGSTGPIGLSTLVHMVNEAAGANCTTGGKRINVGPDSNSNGVLDAGEISSSSYVCNGATGATGATGAAGNTGATGASGLNTLMTLDAESSGANCAYGGTKVSSGLDSNANQVLDAAEVSSTRYVCNGAPGASINWTNVTGTSAQAISNAGYIANNSGTQVAITLPANPSFGDVVRISGAGAAGWRIAQNAGQSIYTANLNSPNTGLVMRESKRNWGAAALSSDGTTMLAAVDGGQLYVSTDSGVTWTARESNRNWNAVAISADGNTMAAVVWSGLIYISTDRGATWDARETSRNWAAVVMTSDGRTMKAFAYNGCMHWSNDYGNSWSAICTASATKTWWRAAMSSDGQILVGSTQNSPQQPLYISTDGGINWSATSIAPTDNCTGLSMSADGRTIFATTYSGIHFSSNQGVDWITQESQKRWKGGAMSADANLIVAAAENGQLYTKTIQYGKLANNWTILGPSQDWTTVGISNGGQKWLASGNNTYLHLPSSWTSNGTSGGIQGRQFDTLELQYMGSGQFNAIQGLGALAFF